MNDAEIAAHIREAVGKLNHFCHVASHHGLFVQLTAAQPDDPRRVGCLITDVCVMRPVLPPAPTGSGPDGALPLRPTGDDHAR